MTDAQKLKIADDYLSQHKKRHVHDLVKGSINEFINRAETTHFKLKLSLRQYPRLFS